MAATRLPKGYLGKQHETIGSDILAVLNSLKLPEQVLGEPATAELRLLQPDAWYPIQQLLDLMETLDRMVGQLALRRMGRTLFKLSHEARVKGVLKSARDVVHGIDTMYHHANRGGSIGGWRVLSFEPGEARLEKTTPHHCAMEEGILDAALSCVGAPSRIAQESCFRSGAESCVFVIKSAVTGPTWG